MDQDVGKHQSENAPIPVFAVKLTPNSIWRINVMGAATNLIAFIGKDVLVIPHSFEPFGYCPRGLKSKMCHANNTESFVQKSHCMSSGKSQKQKQKADLFIPFLIKLDTTMNILQQIWAQLKLRQNRNDHVFFLSFLSLLNNLYNLTKNVSSKLTLLFSIITFHSGIRV